MEQLHQYTNCVENVWAEDHQRKHPFPETPLAPWVMKKIQATYMLWSQQPWCRAIRVKVKWFKGLGLEGWHDWASENPPGTADLKMRLTQQIDRHSAIHWPCRETRIWVSPAQNTIAYGDHCALTKQDKRTQRTAEDPHLDKSSLTHLSEDR